MGNSSSYFSRYPHPHLEPTLAVTYHPLVISTKRRKSFVNFGQEHQNQKYKSLNQEGGLGGSHLSESSISNQKQMEMKLKYENKYQREEITSGLASTPRRTTRSIYRITDS